MECYVCNRTLSNQFSYNRHCVSDIHYHNMQNPYHVLRQYTCKDNEILIESEICDLIWEYTYIKKGKVLDHLEGGNMWAAYDIIKRRKMLPLCYTLVPAEYNPPHREIRVTQYNSVHKHCIFISGGYSLNIPMDDAEYVWGKLANIKDSVIKQFIYGPDKINDMVDILW